MCIQLSKDVFLFERSISSFYSTISISVAVVIHSTVFVMAEDFVATELSQVDGRKKENRGNFPVYWTTYCKEVSSKSTKLPPHTSLCLPGARGHALTCTTRLCVPTWLFTKQRQKLFNALGLFWLVIFTTFSTVTSVECSIQQRWRSITGMFCGLVKVLNGNLKFRSPCLFLLQVFSCCSVDQRGLHFIQENPSTEDVRVDD